MRYVWTVQGDDPDYGQGDKYGITGYLSPLPSVDPLTPTVVAQSLAHGSGAGIYLGHAWFPGMSGKQLAEKVNVDYKATKKTHPTAKLRVMFNLEEHEPAKILECLERWRVLQPNVNTSWSMEGMQGGWMGPVLSAGGVPSPFVLRVLACRVRLVPQCFVGNMARRESDIVLRDLTRRGFPESVISMFYDAANLGADWDGFAFTMGRLPWIP